MTPQLSRRGWTQWMVLLTGVALLLGGRHVYALEKRGDIGRTVQEIRDCENRNGQWRGARWTCDGLEIAKAVIRRVSELIAGVADEANKGREQGNLLEKWGLSDRDKEFLRNTFSARFYLPDQLSDDTTSSGSSTKALAGQRGRVLQAATDPGIQSWEHFLENTAPITQNQFGKVAIFGLAALGRQAQLHAAFQEIAPEGKFLPKFRGEQGQGTSSAQTTNQTSDEIIRPAELQSQAHNAALGEGLVAAAIASTNPPQTSNKSPDRPSISVPEEGDKETTRSPVDPQKTGKAAGSADALVTGRPQGGSGLGALACPTCGGGGQGAGGVNSFLGGSPFSQALNRFGLGGLSNLASLFNPSQFGNLLGNRFPQGGTGGGGPQPTTTQAPPAGICESQQPRLSATDVQQASDFLGLPVTPSPWIVQYRPVSSVVGASGVNAESGVPMTVTPAVFPDQTCVWTVTATLPDGTTQVVFTSDTSSGTGSRFRLIL